MDGSAGPTAASPVDFSQADLLQENQLRIGSPDPHQPLPENLSSHELLSLARAHIQSARQSITAAARPFAGKGSLFSRHYHDAITRLNTSIEHAHYLLELLPAILTRLLEQETATLFTKHEEIKVEIYRMIDEAERLILLLQKENEKDRQNIVQKADALEKLLQELLLAF